MASNIAQSLLITGASSGLGLAIALHGLTLGHAVIGTARNISKAKVQHPQFEAKGGKWLELDVTDTHSKDIVAKAVDEAGVDVLVNNAGHGLYGVFEDMSEAEIRQQMETNFFGSVRILQAVIPHFRKRRSGTIVTMSSISGLTVISPSGLMYAASKHALEAISEGLALQLALFGIKVLIVEPGAFRTNWLQGSYATPKKEMTADYVDGPVDVALQRYSARHGAQAGDPAKAATVILDFVGDEERLKAGKCSRLPLGCDAIDFGRAHATGLLSTFDQLEEVARSAVFPAE